MNVKKKDQIETKKRKLVNVVTNCCICHLLMKCCIEHAYNQ